MARPSSDVRACQFGLRRCRCVDRTHWRGQIFVVAVTLGFVLGYVLTSPQSGVSENAQLHSRIGALLERVSLSSTQSSDCERSRKRRLK